MRSGLHPGSIILILLLILAISGLIFVKSIVSNTFKEAQTGVEAGIQDRFDPFSSKYSLSHHMGAIETWITFTNERYKYKITHPRFWNRLESRNYPGAEDLYEAALSSNVKLSLTVQKIFVEPKETAKIKTLEGTFTIFADSLETKAAFIKKNNLYYIIRIQQNNYFGSDQEFLGTFYNILKRFEFLD
ncbi:hypothetical protein A3J17_03820 [Candidatus Curtissbacteria bacterium RIFCSPLOWO2_02_FULL_40_11]|uniref:PsbP C-terminal domain-containing protein n=1 Tax=Candidatus Curtissbacteria bacterium RIFCSPLOWO2_12_FULL_38_9 TaxID=1797735 RepID=A0A1F5ICD8_9BACT|nr:MAG: hypothetical protein A3J17_03820 [Candidatus Curtissbacteria bacterium RIFCSPLOWO2_02_FULL_40_11]OGE14005.1 MAG: hypothetical protein A3G14_03725 [Candidatus Curtissbacteria bacterium RIFCSPLOWO2_12_FULL_38_9]